MLRMESTQKINSRDNTRIKNARAVRDGREAGQIFIEGWRLADEALSSSLVIKDIYIAEASTRDERVRIFKERIGVRNLEPVEISGSIAQSLSDTRSPQGIFIIAERPRSGRDAIENSFGHLSGGRVVVFLDRINNPSNLGAIVRTAEAAGAAGILVSPGSADPFSPKGLRASMGSAFRLPIVEGCDFREAKQWAGEHGAIASGAVIDGRATSYTEIDWNKKRLLMFGSEAHGIDKDAWCELDELIRIPMARGVESLNLAVACGVMLFEAKRHN